ncbi:hypothetical protein Deia_00414 [Candidatus Deianiraea vastatrix]|uniref:Lipoprotein n=1 Tax=Candidatus Deianiraea vastatrix TaxID=2163644 RepID=A0A5B8XHA6_9RICK|nr:hypothetical protein Deia_00414 [Candidatus Deianiraea vastatrix]
MKQSRFIYIFLVFFMLTIVSCKKQSNITLIAKGQGGDRNGAILLQKYFPMSH